VNTTLTGIQNLSKNTKITTKSVSLTRVFYFYISPRTKRLHSK